MANKRKKTFNSFEHDTGLHTRKEVVAMNNKYPNLVGYGILCALMEMCAKQLSGEIPFSKIDKKVIAASLSVDERTFMNVIEYLDAVGFISIGKEFMKVDVIEKEIIRKRLNRERIRTSVAENRDKIKRKKGINVNVRETEGGKRRRIWNEFDEILILTDRIVNDARLKYPLHGDIPTYFKHFIRFVKVGYAEYHGKITHDNYVAQFYVYMNSYKLPLLEALDEHEKRTKIKAEITPMPPKFGFNRNNN